MQEGCIHTLSYSADFFYLFISLSYIHTYIYTYIHTYNNLHHHSKFLDVDCVEESFHFTALMHAVVFDDDALVRILLRLDPDPFILNENGRNALFIAAERGCVSILQLLFDFYSGSGSGDEETTDRSAKYSMHVHSPVCQDANTTALHVAALYDRPTVVSYLIRQRGADPHKRDGQGRTPLDRAKESGSKSAEQLLLTLT